MQENNARGVYIRLVTI